MKIPARAFLMTSLCSAGLWAWSPRFHEVQTRLAKRMLPRPMSRFLSVHETALLEGARGVASDQVPTVEEVEEQFQRILNLSEARKSPTQLAREMGILAKQVQLLADPSATLGVTPIRSTFEAFGDEVLAELILSREPIWALGSSLNPRPRLIGLAETKYARHRSLAGSIDPASGGRIGVWDRLSMPYGQMQLAYSSGINATANLFILLWRAAGDHWPVTDSSLRKYQH